MNKLTKMLLTVLIAVGILGSVAGTWASGTSEKTSGTKVIKFLDRYPEEPQNGYINQMIGVFEKDNPGVTIQRESVHYDSYPAKLQTSLSSDSQPDVFFAYPGEFLNRFVRDGLVYDITSAFNADTAWKDGVIASLIAPYYYNGHLYGLPFRVDAKAMFYNKTMFDKYGLQPPKTWSDLVQIFKTLKDNGITPVAFGDQGRAWPAMHYIGQLNQELVDNTVRLRDYNPAHGQFTDPGYLQALKDFMTIISYSNPHPNALTHEMARQNFVNGKEAMMYLETIETPNVEQSAPAGFKFGIFAFPEIPSGLGEKGFIQGAPEGFVILKNTKYPKEALSFLKFITGPVVGKGLLKNVGWFNASKGVVDASYPDPAIRDAYQMLISAKGLTNWFDTALNAQLASKYESDLQLMIDNQMTPEQVMKDIQSLAAQVRNSSS